MKRHQWWDWKQNALDAAAALQRGRIKRQELVDLQVKFSEEGHPAAAQKIAEVLTAVRPKRHPPFWRRFLAAVGIIAAVGAASGAVARNSGEHTETRPGQERTITRFESTEQFDTFVQEYVREHYNRLWDEWSTALGVNIPRPSVEFVRQVPLYAARYDHEEMRILVNITGTDGVNFWVVHKKEESEYAAFLSDTLMHEFGHHFAQLRARALNVPFMRHGRCDSDEMARQCVVDEGIAESLNVTAQGKQPTFTHDDTLNWGPEAQVRHEQGFRTVHPVLQEQGLPGVDRLLRNQPQPGENLGHYRTRMMGSR